VLIAPNYEALGPLAAGKPPEEACANPEVQEIFRRAVDKVNEALSQPEQLKKFALIPEPLTIAKGDLTPTLKVRRRAIEEKYRALIEGMYRE
jgi:long-chain acyl-CoA synthetase